MTPDMNEISTFVSLAASIAEFIDMAKNRKDYQADKVDFALEKVVIATERTKTYLNMRASTGERSQLQEQELAELWALASHAIRKVDRNFHFTLKAKSIFWRNPDTWEEDHRSFRDISLETVSERCRALQND